MKFFSVKVPLWPVLFIAAGFVAVFILGALGALKAPQALLGLLTFGQVSESRNTQVINSVNRQEEVALLSLGIEGISEKNERSNLFGVDVPGSARVSFMQYGFKAKLGIDGKSVRITQTGDDRFLVSIPEFIFIGHDDERFKLVTENNGALSWITPQIDAVEMVNDILNDDAKDQYIESNEAILKDQATSFYKGIIAGIDPDIVVEFEFRS